MTCLCVSHYFPTLWRRVSHRPPSMSLSLSYPSLSPPLCTCTRRSSPSCSYLGSALLAGAHVALGMSSETLGPHLTCEAEAGPHPGKAPVARRSREQTDEWRAVGWRKTCWNSGSKMLTHCWACWAGDWGKTWKRGGRGEKMLRERTYVLLTIRINISCILVKNNARNFSS